MLLARETSVILTNEQSNIIGHMCYAAYKLWNVCNYERLNYKELKLPCDYPNWSSSLSVFIVTSMVSRSLYFKFSRFGFIFSIV